MTTMTTFYFIAKAQRGSKIEEEEEEKLEAEGDWPHSERGT